MIKRRYILLIFIPFLFLVTCLILTCKKLPKEMMVVTGQVTDITMTTASVSGEIIDVGEGVTEHGHCYSKTQGADINDFKTQLGKPSGPKSYNSSLTGLEPATAYYIRSYITDGEKIVYGREISFQTISCTVPTVTTNAATGVGTTTATLNGTVNANGSSTTVTFEYGLTTSYGSTVNAAQSPVTGSSNIAVSANISGLTAGTTYHYKVKAENCGGAIYGMDQTFTTGCIVPTATTNSATGVGITTATLNGTVNANGSTTTVTFEYGLTTSYGSTVTAAQSPFTGSSNTAVSANISGLTAGTTYHYRVKAVNCGGTIYGTDQTFMTILSDIDGNIYPVIFIGTQL